MNPACPCGKRPIPFRKEWHNDSGRVNSVATGFRCKKCGYWGVPFGIEMSAEEFAAQELEYERLRSEGIAFDTELEVRFSKCVERPVPCVPVQEM